MAAALAAAKSCDMGGAAEAEVPHPAAAAVAMGGDGDEELVAELAADAGEAASARLASAEEADCQAVAPARSMVSERASSPLVE